MSVIIRLQNLPWSANALDIRNFFRGLSIPEGGVHIVGGELGDAFIAFSTDEDARQAMMLDGGKIKEIQAKLLLSSRSEMHKVIESARQNVPLMTLQSTVVTAPAPVHTLQPTPQPAVVVPQLGPFAPALGTTTSLSSMTIPGIGNPLEVPQPAVIEPPVTTIIKTIETPNQSEIKKSDSKEKERRRTRSRSRSRDRDKKDSKGRDKKDRRDRSRSRDRSRERRRRDRSRSRERRDRKRDRKDRSRSRERSDSRRSRDYRNEDRLISPANTQLDPIKQQIPKENIPIEKSFPPAFITNNASMLSPATLAVMGRQQAPASIFSTLANGPLRAPPKPETARFTPVDPSMVDAFNRLQEIGKKRDPNAFQGNPPNMESNGPQRFRNLRGGHIGGREERSYGSGNGRRDGRPSRFENSDLRDCCIVIKNAPTHTSYGDVRRFFLYMIDKHGIKMINDNLGRRTGTIFVRFTEPRSKHMALQQRTNILKGKQVIVEPLADAEFNDAVDSYMPVREEDDVEPAGLVIAESEDPKSLATNAAALPPRTVLKLEDLPFFVKELDIIKAFSDYALLSIMLNDCKLTRTKIAHVQFVKADDAQKAYVLRERLVFGNRQAQVTLVADEEYEKEKATQGEHQPIPEVEIVNKHPPVEDAEPEIVAPRDPRQRRPPPRSDDAPMAQPTNMSNVLPMTGTPFPAQMFPQHFPTPSFAAFPTQTSANAPNVRVTQPAWPRPLFSGENTPAVAGQETRPAPDEGPLDSILMKGLPDDATDRTIVDFLSETNAVPARIHLMLDVEGRPSGDCFCEFRSPHEASRAAKMHDRELEGCRITIDLVNRRVVEDALEGPKNGENEVVMNDVPPPLFFDRGGYMPRGFRGRPMMDRGRGMMDRGRGFRRGGFDRSRGFEGRGRGRGFGRGRGGFESNGRDITRDPDPEMDPGLEDFGAPGCVLSMENVPFRATVEDILDFFEEFQLTHDDVIRRFNERGLATGDARVAFRTPFDAQRALKAHNFQHMYERRISLRLI